MNWKERQQIIINRLLNQICKLKMIKKQKSAHDWTKSMEQIIIKA